MIFSDDDIEKMIRLVYSGKVTEYALDEGTYFAIADYLKKGLYEGFGITFGELTNVIEKGLDSIFDAKDLELLTELRENIYIFSGAKTFQETKDFRGAMIGENGEVKSFKEFKEDALKLNEQWNQNWLKTEYETAYGQAQNAVRWNEIEKVKDILPVLKYSAVLDDRTSDICVPLDGITLPVEHPFWDTFMPLNHFNCRCTVEQHDESEKLSSKELVEEKSGAVGKEMNDLFKMNAGKERVAFKTDGDGKHPYFDIEKKDKEYAKNNFNLTIPEKD